MVLDMQKIKLTDKEKKILAFLHFRDRINGKFRKEQLDKLQNHVHVTQKELNSFIKKFLKKKLIFEVKDKKGRITSYLADKLTQEMVDKNVLRIRNFIIFTSYRSKI